MFNADNEHLELLFEFGLGRDAKGPWHRLLGSAVPSPTQMLQDQLRWACAHDMGARVELLLAHGVDPDAPDTQLFFGATSPYELAMLAGNTDTAELLVSAGARRATLDDAQAVVARCMSASPAATFDRPDAAVLAAAIATDPEAPIRAARLGRGDAVQRLADHLAAAVAKDPGAGGRRA